MSGDAFEWGVAVLRPIRPDEVELLARAGVGRVAVHVPWRWAEKRRGDFDAAAVHHFLEPLRSAAMPVQAILGPGMPHLVPDWVEGAGGVDSPDYPTWFADYCGWAAEELPWVDAFRIEDNLNAAFLWDGLRTRRRRGRRWRDPALAPELLAAAFSAVRAARPGARLGVSLHAGVPAWRRALRRWLATGLKPERVGLTVQPCMVLPDPAMAERVGEVVRQARAVLEEAGSPAAVEVARTGYATHRRLFSPRRQREFLVGAGRAAREAGAAGLTWWALRDQAYDDPILRYWTPAQERHMGLLYYDSTPKPAMDELRVLATGDRFGEAGG